MKEHTWTAQERTELVLEILAGERTVEDAARERGLDPAEIGEWRDFYLTAARQGARSASTPLRPRVGRALRHPAARAVGAVFVVAFVLLGSAKVMSQATNCTSGLLCFNPNAPAKANEVNANFTQLKNWVEQKVGAVGIADVTISGNASFGATVRQMLNLWGTQYGIGVQASTLYMRSDKNFAWHLDGSHDGGELNPGGGTLLMSLEGTTTHPILALETANGSIAVSDNFAFNDTGDSWLRLNTVRSRTTSPSYADLAVQNLWVQNGLGRFDCAWTGCLDTPSSSLICPADRPMLAGIDIAVWEDQYPNGCVYTNGEDDMRLYCCRVGRT